MQIFQARIPDQHDQIRTIFTEYLQWGATRLQQEYAILFELESMIEQDMRKLDTFAPPAGRLLLAEIDGQIAGCICMRQIGPDTAEIKRMYVRPPFRHCGVGRALLESAVQAARETGYARVRLDSTRFMHAAHALYRSIGFCPIEAYPESDIPPQYYIYWVFMELPLA